MLKFKRRIFTQHRLILTDSHPLSLSPTGCWHSDQVSSQRPAGRALHRVGRGGLERTAWHLVPGCLGTLHLSFQERVQVTEGEGRVFRAPLKAKAGPFTEGGASSPVW